MIGFRILRHPTVSGLTQAGMASSVLMRAIDKCLSCWSSGHWM